MPAAAAACCAASPRVPLSHHRRHLLKQGHADASDSVSPSDAALPSLPWRPPARSTLPELPWRPDPADSTASAAQRKELPALSTSLPGHGEVTVDDSKAAAARPCLAGAHPAAPPTPHSAAWGVVGGLGGTRRGSRSCIAPMATNYRRHM